jgi:AraC-like DNA-binding protein
MGMSRAQLYRKFNALTNQTVKEFVRTVRLKKAAELLDSGQHNVSEVAWAVGFGDLPYFTRSFKIQYGINPSKFSLRKTRIKTTSPEFPKA